MRLLDEDRIVKILLVEDSERLRRSLGDGLAKAGYAVDSAGDGEEALTFLSLHQYEVVVLDLMLPRLPGLDVLRTIRERGIDVHVLILSARDRVEDRVEGLSLGADDYLIKPFHFAELRARLQAVIRRRFEVKAPLVRRGRLELDLNLRVARVDGETVPLTPSEYRVLEVLALRPLRVYSRRQLLFALYRSDSDVSENVIEVFVSGLRRKLERFAQRSLIRTHRGVGYYLDDGSSGRS